MIMKIRGIDLHLEGLQALSKRLPESHPQRETIDKKIRMKTAGIRGELNLVKVFENYTFLDEIYILHDVSFYSTGRAQIDCLVITPNFALILEVKNIAGDMSFLVGTGQISRVLENGQIDHFESPMVQIDRNSDLLFDWFRLKDIHMPILGAVVLSNSTQKVNVQPNQHPVLFLGEIPSFIKRQIKNQNTIEPNQAKIIAEMLVEAHQPFNPFPICDRWHVDTACLKKGVFCTKCCEGMMKRSFRTWICEACFHRDPYAHIQAIKEWFMLIGGEITNKKCREFLGVQSHQLVSRLLKEMNLIIEGKGNRTTYKMGFRE
ncbi:nuclease-related domain-containing protein [Paenisporosarcina sp.]|uniref:nuclease-related domain-containing protein n=1 Tax=Paenisporosarcina sp. TaxID=1932001 RepID=UPI003C77FDFE